MFLACLSTLKQGGRGFLPFSFVLVQPRDASEGTPLTLLPSSSTPRSPEGKGLSHQGGVRGSPALWVLDGTPPE